MDTDLIQCKCPPLDGPYHPSDPYHLVGCPLYHIVGHDGIPVPPSSNESICDRCKGVNPRWVAPSPLWNEVIRNGNIDGKEEFPFVCPNCFITLSEEKGIATEWRLYANDVKVDLQTVTPSGRVWDEKTWMFVDSWEDE